MRTVGAVFVGGVIGTAARYALAIFVPVSAELTTLLINIVGSCVLGLLVSLVWARESTPPWLKAGLGTGVLGGFTTFSAIAIDAAATLPAIGTESTSSALATLGFLLFEIVAGLLAAWAGLALGARNLRSRARPRIAAPIITDDGGDL